MEKRIVYKESEACTCPLSISNTSTPKLHQSTVNPYGISPETMIIFRLVMQTVTFLRFFQAASEGFERTNISGSGW